MKINDEELTPEQKWEQAGLENGFIFYHVFRTHPDACKRLLEILLHIEIEKLEMHEEESIVSEHDSKGIRLDLYIKNDTHVFDVELQMRNTKELPERARYYQGLMDVDTLQVKQHYKDLKTSHVIFICKTDIFDMGLPVYHFENLCLDNPSIKMNDRTYKHFFIINNCDKLTTDTEQQAFLNLLRTKSATTEYTKKLESYVEYTKKDVQWRHTFMEYERMCFYAQEEAREKGLAKGLAEGRKKGHEAGLAEGRKQAQKEWLSKGLAEGRTEGIELKAKETAKNLIKMNILSAEQIALATELSLKQIQQIKQEMQNNQ